MISAEKPTKCILSVQLPVDQKKGNKLLFLFITLIWNRHLCEHRFFSFAKQNMVQ